jgi:ParB/RepB/Spo0J family partition protein
VDEDTENTQPALLPAERPEGRPATVPCHQIAFSSPLEPSPSLRRSVAAVGILQPLLIRRNTNADSLYPWVVTDGNRRLRAALLADLTTVPTLIIEGDANWGAVAQLSTNATRSQNLAADLKSVEQLATAGYTAKEIGQAVGLTRVQVERLLGMQRLDPVLRQGLDDGKLTLGTATEAAKLPVVSQEALAEKFTNEGKLTGGDIAEQKTARAAQALAMTDVDEFLVDAPTLPEHEERARFVSLARQAHDYAVQDNRAAAIATLETLISALES